MVPSTQALFIFFSATIARYALVKKNRQKVHLKTIHNNDIKN